MRILQVRDYHNQIAFEQEKRAAIRHDGYIPHCMFYFMLEDRKGYPTTERQKGYVAFSDNRRKACFGLNKSKAIAAYVKD